jgi:UDP-N-acetylmuramoyl-L-alanyl-D-glutamate--2,6-diaminopimelate ligase
MEPIRHCSVAAWQGGQSMSHRPAARGIRLREVLPDARLIGANDISVTSCTADWRTCRPGDVFVLLPEAKPESGYHLEKALSRGAAAIVAEPGIGKQPAPACIVADSRAALGQICQALAGHPSQSLNVVGIAGSRGKTITSHLIAGVLSAGDYTAAVLGSLCSCDGMDTSPPPGSITAPMLATWLGRSVSHGCTHAVMEISRQSLDQSRIAGVTLDMACVTNALVEDAEKLGAPHAALIKIFEHLSPEGVAIVNADDPSARNLLAAIDTPALSIGIDRAAEISATPVEQTLSDQTFLLSAGSDTIPVRTTLLGQHNIYNCLFAAAVGFGYGMDLSTIARGLESIECVPCRLERIECGQPFGVFVDHASEPGSLGHALQTLRAVTPGRVLCVVPASAELDRFERIRLGRVAGQLADQAIVTHAPGANAINPQPAILQDVVLGARNKASVLTIADRSEAIRWLMGAAEEGDCVLVAGVSPSPVANSDDDEQHDDRSLIRRLLRDATPVEARRAVA